MLCPSILTLCRSFWQLLSHVRFQIQTNLTLSFLKLCLLLLSSQWLSRSEAPKEITQIQRVPDVWNYFSQCCVFDIRDTIDRCFFAVIHALLWKEISYSNISKTVSFFIWLPLVPELKTSEEYARFNLMINALVHTEVLKRRLKTLEGLHLMMSTTCLHHTEQLMGIKSHSEWNVSSGSDAL